MKTALKKTIQTIKMAWPIILGVLMFISLVNPLLQNYYTTVFTDNYFLDPIIGAIIGSISFGIPIISYVTGEELLNNGVSLLAVTAFILAWTTVGIVMLPLESSTLGKKFAISRNLLNFFTAIIVSILTILTLQLF